MEKIININDSKLAELKKTYIVADKSYKESFNMFSSLMEEADRLDDEDLISEDEYIMADMRANKQSKLDINSNLLRSAKNELKQYCYSNLIVKGIMTSELKELFNSRNLKHENKLIGLLLKLQ
jgi:hypothetical protein